jgi:hypothetical protein
MPDDLDRRKAVAELVDQHGRIPACPVGGIAAVEQTAYDVLSGDGRRLVAAFTAYVIRQRVELRIAPQRSSAGRIKFGGELLLSLGTDRVATQRGR